MYPTIDFNKVRMNGRQKLHYLALGSSGGKKTQLQYLMTFLGVKNRELSVQRFHINSDRVFPKVYTMKNEAMSNWMDKMRQFYNASRTKTPTTNHNDWVGVEIECFLNKSDFESEGSGDCECECTCTCDGSCSVGNCRCECEGDCRENCECSSASENYIPSVIRSVQRAKIKNIQVVDDGSLDPDDDDRFGVEIKVLFRMSDYTNLEKICKWLSEHDAVVNTSCGLHVHLDARSVSKQILNEYKNKLPFSDGNFVFNMDKSLKYLVAMLPPSRQKNTYCKYGYSFNDRYSMINCEALDKHGTIEMRAHSGTVSFTKIINWCKILHAVKSAKSVKVKSFNDWVNSIGLTDDLLNYARERISKFSPLILTNEDDSLKESTIESEDSEMAA